MSIRTGISPGLRRAGQSTSLRQRFRRIIVALAVGLVLVAVARALERHRAEEKALKARALDLAVSATSSLDATISDSHILLTTLSALIVSPFDTLANDSTLASLNRKAPMRFTNIWILDTAGFTVSTARPPRENAKGVSFADRPYFREALRTKAFTVGRSYRSLTVASAPYVLLFAMPMIDRRTSAVSAILLASVLVDSLEAVKAWRLLPDGAVLTALDTTGTVVFRTLDPDHWVGRQFPKDRSVVQDVPLDESVDEGTAADGVSRLVAYRRTKNAPWTVYVGIPSRYTLDAARWQFVQDIIGASLLIALVGWLGFRLIGRIVQPIESLTAAAVAYAEGDLSRRATIRTNDEVGQLATAFNHLADTVVDRTAALARSLEQLSHSQKMDALGLFAGGIAHDFNNYLTAIIGNAEFALSELDEGSPAREDMNEVLRSAQSAAQLTRQILVFSRKQVVQPQLLELRDVIEGISKLIERLLGDTTRTSIVLDPAPSAVRLDRSQLEQMLVNLAANARDAMPNGGEFRLSTTVRTIDASDAALHGTIAGDWVVLSVQDTGVGMTSEVKARVFEPFFTTKERGHGTGLGLALAYGVVEQAGGHILIDSAPGRGTTVAVYLPNIRDVASRRPTDGVQPVGKLPSARILLAEDDTAVRLTTARALTQAGHLVQACLDGETALRALEGGAEFDLLLTDIMMPGMTGTRLAQEVRARRPEIGVLFMSGFPDDQKMLDGLSVSSVAFLAKPFQLDDLLRAVHRELEAVRSARSNG